jgi:general stress protein 26
MGQPLTSIDSRYSDPEAVPTTWEDTSRALAESELFWLTTVSSDGRPHVTPLVAVWSDEALHFTTGADEKKAANLRANSRVVLTTGCNTWSEGVDIVVEGEAVLVTDEAVMKRLSEAWLTKWDGRWKFYPEGGSFHHSAGFEVLLYTVAPTKVFAFAKGAFAQTVHRFPPT